MGNMLSQRLALTVGFVAGVPVVLLLVTLTILYTGLKVIWTDDFK